MEKMQQVRSWLKQHFGIAANALGVTGLIPVVIADIVKNGAGTALKSHESTRHPARQSETAFIVGCFIAVILFAVINFFFLREIDFTLIYLFIALVATWKGGTGPGISIALTGWLASFVVGIFHDVALGILGVNLGIQLGVSLPVIFLVSAIRGSFASLEQRVADRSRALEYEIHDRKQSEERLHKSTQQFRQLAENVADVFWMRDLDSARMAYVSPAYEKIWQRSCQSLYQSTGAWPEAIHPEDRELVSQAIQTRQPVGEYSQEYRIILPDGAVRWIRDRAFPIRDVTGKVIRMVGIAEDITNRRQLEREILEISDREQARMGQDLHDGLCQKLVSIAFDSNSLEQRLAGKSQPEADAARKMGDLLDEAISEARALSQGLFPVQLEANGLPRALQQLAAGINSRTKVNCRVDCLPFKFMPDNAVAVHLYRIAQEAVNNALKHSQASSILIQLKVAGGRIELKISDNGVGIPVPSRSTGGMGLHIMDYRAQTIGGSLQIERAAGGGTLVSCSAPQPAE
jgi:PAS domain S-box-containing protein